MQDANRGRRRAAAGALAASLLTVCGPSASNGVDEPAANVSDVERFCFAVRALAVRCGAPAGSACGLEGIPDGTYRESFLTRVPECLETLPCNESDEVCVADWSMMDPAFPEIPAMLECLEAHEACGYEDDLCFSLTALTDAAREAARACWRGGCDGAEECLRASGSYSY